MALPRPEALILALIRALILALIRALIRALVRDPTNGRFIAEQALRHARG